MQAEQQRQLQRREGRTAGMNGVQQVVRLPWRVQLQGLMLRKVLDHGPLGSINWWWVMDGDA